MSPDTLLITVCVFVGVAALVVGLFQVVQGVHISKAERRLARWAGSKLTPTALSSRAKPLLAEPLHAEEKGFEKILGECHFVRTLIEQADVNLTPTQLLAFSGALGCVGVAIAVTFQMPVALWPFLGGGGCFLPWLWLLWRRNRRLKAFAAQMPEAMDMLARALRAGQSLAAGIGLVGKEMPPPLGKEFSRVFEEQNLGISLEDSLKDLTERVPNMDLKFFATAVILQRQTGGDLAEILEKIATLIRQRFQIWGQVQALTGEGRLSGVVLLALPVFLFFAMYYLNRDYVMLLFTDPLGNRMLMIGVIMQVLGALVIRKIVNIKV
jgi:tight adherence protein B